jgi:hypothetical protein
LEEKYELGEEKNGEMRTKRKTEEISRNIKITGYDKLK